MSFRDQSWDERFAKLGDEAELQFVSWAAKARLGWTKYGLDRPPIRVGEVPARIRYTPDFLMSKCLVEAQGFGRDNLTKLKTDKHGCLHYWNDVMPTYLFWWDSHNSRSCFMHILDYDALLPHAEIKCFPEGKSYYAINGDLIFAHGVDRPERLALS